MRSLKDSFRWAHACLVDRYSEKLFNHLPMHWLEERPPIHDYLFLWIYAPPSAILGLILLGEELLLCPVFLFADAH